jgi:hypothetical protein
LGDPAVGASVIGSHTYVDEGTYTIKLTVKDTSDNTTGTATSTATITEGDAGTLAGNTLTATSGQAFTGTLATFTDTGVTAPGIDSNVNTGATAVASDFTAKVDWGDGTTTAGTVTGPTGGPFNIGGTHPYTNDGSYTTKITLTDDAPGTFTATGTGTANVHGNLTVTRGAAISIPEQQAFNGTVATFTGSTAAASAFAASINWGDGTSSTGTVSGSTGGPFTVTGSHTYTDELTNGTYSVTVSEPGVNFTATPVTASVNVTEADVLSVSTTPTGTAPENFPFSGAFASFDDSNKSAVASDFSATLDFGDGTTFSTAAGNLTITGGAGTPFRVSTTVGHAYADEGVYTFKVTLSDDAPGSATATATGTLTIIEGDAFSGTGLTITPVEQASFTGGVATFTNTGSSPNPDITDFTATIDWGDGTTTAGTLSGSSSSITVSGTHTYVEDGIYTTAVTLTDEAPGTATATVNGTANVAEATLTAAPVSISTTEGQHFSGLVGIASDPGSTDPASEFSVTIDWGDGTTTTGTVTGSDGSYNLFADHTYTDEGSLTAKVTFFENDDPTTTVSVNSPVTVADGDVLSGSGITFSGTEGQSFSGTVATFTNTGFPANPSSDFTATIDWGDGTTTTGTVATSAGSPYTVTGSHTYTDEGTFTTKVTLSDDVPGTGTATATGAATIAEGDVLSGTGSPISGTEGQSFSGTVATFTNTGFLANPSSDFTATIDWGDGTTTTGTVAGSAGSPYTVTGSHTYTEEGTFTTKVILSDAPGTATATATGTATIADADVFTVTGVNFSVNAGGAFAGTVANFTDKYTGNVASDFTATIDWGDGTTSPGTITGSNGSFSVTGSHTYSTGGQFTVSVQVADDAPGTATGSGSNTATVTFPPLSPKLQQQLLVDLLMQPLLGTPQALKQAQTDLAALFGQASLQSGQQATNLMENELALIFDLELGFMERVLGINDTALATSINQLGYAIGTNPLYGTPVDYDLGLVAGALAIHATTQS